MNAVNYQLPAPAWVQDESIREYAIVVAGVSIVPGDTQRIESWLSGQGIPIRVVTSAPADEYFELLLEARGAQAFGIFERLYRQLDKLDVFMLPQISRKKAVLVCDMDSTIIQTESLDELADYMGIGAQIAAITRRAMNGEIDFAAALEERVALLTGLPTTDVEDCVSHTRYNDGARELVAAARAGGLRTVLVSGGFSPFVSYVAKDLGFDRWVANTLDIRDNQLTGRVLPPIIDKDTKLAVLQEECAALGVGPESACTIGDGANDIDMLAASGLGIAYRAKAVVLEAVPYHLRHSSLATVIRVLDLAPV
ncbi:MAG: phosphoserine phosphatase SerB [Gammaproteobacteria bacterium]|nr:phosphoserine phosphatase SerB [Gammaproteobacteria bacterium]